MTATRDFEYEQNNVAYDCRNPEGAIKCKNYELCEALLPTWWYECKGYFCTNCDMLTGSQELTFEKRPEDSCPVCLRHDDDDATELLFMKFPACSHWFCVPCTRNIIYQYESRYYLSPFPFGCPPCTNGCLAELCCDVCEETYKNWERDSPQQFREYIDAESKSIEDGFLNPIYGTRQCPLCRTKMLEILWNTTMSIM